MTEPFTPSQQPDASSGVRYSKAFKYVFAMLKPDEDLTTVDVSAVVGAGTSLIDEGRFVVLQLPREIQWRSPYATVVTMMQDGGKVIESKGNVMRVGTISGTTGFLPPTGAVPLQSTQGRLVPNVPDLDRQLGTVSGYLAFQKLRYLFDQYGDMRRQGLYNVRFYFFDYKNDDFWRIEPESFDWNKSSRRPMTYDYNVAFKTIERADPTVRRDRQVGATMNTWSVLSGNPRSKSYVSPIQDALGRVAGGVIASTNTPIFATVRRLASLVTSGLNFLKHCGSVVQQAGQEVLTKIDDVVGFFENIHDTFFTLIQIVPDLLAQVDSSLAGLIRVVNKFSSDSIAAEWNAWTLEVTHLLDHMNAQVNVIVASQPQRDVRNADQSFSQGRGKQGSTTDLMQEPTGSTGSLDANPFIGSSGLSLVTDVSALANGNSYTTTIINAGEDIYALARRVFGQVERFIDLILINCLEFPYIVGNPTQRPPSTLAWGDYIRIPASSGSSVTTIADASGDPPAPSVASTVSAVSGSMLTDGGANWLTNEWVGYTVTATTGGVSQSMIVASNTATDIVPNGTWTITITPFVTTYTLAYIEFHPRRPVTVSDRAYGRDLLLVFGNDGRADFARGPLGDLATASGLDNFIQAITMRARCPLGQHPVHADYGMPSPVGRPYNDNVGALYTFFMRRSLLADPRVGKVQNLQLALSGDTVTLSAEIQPVDARVAQPMTLKVGA